MQRSGLLLLPLLMGLLWGCGSETPHPPPDTPEGRAAIQEADAAVYEAESQNQ